MSKQCEVYCVTDEESRFAVLDPCSFISGIRGSRLSQNSGLPLARLRFEKECIASGCFTINNCRLTSVHPQNCQ